MNYQQILRPIYVLIVCGEKLSIQVFFSGPGLKTHP